MVDQAFALSPISARAAQPSEADYEAIQEAFMETSRGRWFLGEYAKRNRNTDTRMVLDAVARIEETLTAQQQPVVEDRTPEVFAAIRKALTLAELATTAVLDRAAIEHGLGPVHRGIRIIKEISWRWREIGADSRICDLIDSQLLAIASACEQLSTIDPRQELKAAFDLIRNEIALAEAGEGSEAVPPRAAAEATGPAAPAPVGEAEAAATSEAPSVVAEMPPDVPSSGEVRAEAVPTKVAILAEPIEVGEPAADAVADAHDEAVLEMVALEMAAPDPDFDDLIGPAAVAADIAEPAAVEQLAVAEVAEMAASVVQSPSPVTARAAPPPTPAQAPQPASDPSSLGATILASGIVRKPRATPNDPLAPIRRMTQAERIAFFS